MHLNTALYISSVALYRKQTGRCTNDFDAIATVQSSDSCKVFTVRTTNFVKAEPAVGARIPGPSAILHCRFCSLYGFSIQTRTRAA